jgi:two-component system sensor histidine kinase KdpD
MGTTTVPHPAAGSEPGLSTTRLQFIRRKTAPLTPGVLVLAGTLACTWISYRLGFDLATVGFLYLVSVVLAATYGGFWQATWISVVSVACLDYFFSEPVFSFTVNRLSDWVELGAFEFTALVISQLSNRAHLREMEAVSERHDTERLYETARRVLLSSAANPGNEVASLIRQMFGFEGVALFDALSVELYESGECEPDILMRTQDAYTLEADSFDPEENRCFCVLRLGVRAVGALALCGARVKPLTATALASLAAIALERSRMVEKQCQAEAARQAEQLRTAVLDALAHKFKTPLTVIRTASSGLPAAGDLSELQRDLVSMIDQEARKLNDLASRLVSAPALDFNEFEVQPEPLLLSRLMKAAILEIDQQKDRARFQIVTPPSEVPVFADKELILTALSQLVDNALKYSVPESPIDVAISVRGKAVTLKIRTKGLVVSTKDRERIFERFYRTSAAQACSAGTGLGLSIVKSIAADHHGHVWAEGEPKYGTVFWFSLPVMQDGVACEQ